VIGSLSRFFSWWGDTAALAHLEHEDSRGVEGDVLTIDAAGWIHGPGVIHMPSARGRGPLTSPGGEPIAVVRHGTATAWGTAGAITRNWRETYDTHSAHATLDEIEKKARDAEVARWRKRGWRTEAAQLAAMAPGDAVLYQHRSLLSVAWHAAGSDDVDGKKVVTSGTVGGLGLNDCSIGIEATCVGQVARGAGGHYRGWARGKGVGFGPAVPDNQVEVIGKRAWHRYPPAALELERRLDAALLARFPSLAGEVTITPSPYAAAKTGAKPVTRPAMAVGHIDVDPVRKSDPYPTGARRGR
jgi:N-acetylmuramoyl-L-alanine amidase